MRHEATGPAALAAAACGRSRDRVCASGRPGAVTALRTGQASGHRGHQLDRAGQARPQGQLQHRRVLPRRPVAAPCCRAAGAAAAEAASLVRGRVCWRGACDAPTSAAVAVRSLTRSVTTGDRGVVSRVGLSRRCSGDHQFFPRRLQDLYQRELHFYWVSVSGSVTVHDTARPPPPQAHARPCPPPPSSEGKAHTRIVCCDRLVRPLPSGKLGTACPSPASPTGSSGSVRSKKKWTMVCGRAAAALAEEPRRARH